MPKKITIEEILKWDKEGKPKEAIAHEIFKYNKRKFPDKNVEFLGEEKGFEGHSFMLLNTPSGHWDELIKAGVDKETIESAQSNIKYNNRLYDCGKIPDLDKPYYYLIPATEKVENPESEFQLHMWCIPKDFESVIKSLEVFTKKAEQKETTKERRIALGLMLDFIATSDYLDRNVKKNYGIKIERLEDDIRLEETVIKNKKVAREKAIDFLKAIMERTVKAYDKFKSVSFVNINEIEEFDRRKAKLKKYEDDLENIVTENEKVGICPADASPSNFLIYYEKIDDSEGKETYQVTRKIIDQKGEDERLIFGPLAFIRGYFLRSAEDHKIPQRTLKVLTSALKKAYPNDKIAEIGKFYADIKIVKDHYKIIGKKIKLEEKEIPTEKYQKENGSISKSSAQKELEKDYTSKKQPSVIKNGNLGESLENLLGDFNQKINRIEEKVDDLYVEYLTPEKVEIVKEKGLTYHSFHKEDFKEYEYVPDHGSKLEVEVKNTREIVTKLIKKLVEEKKIGKVLGVEMLYNCERLYYFSFVGARGEYRSKIRVRYPKKRTDAVIIPIENSPEQIIEYKNQNQ